MALDDVKFLSVLLIGVFTTRTEPPAVPPSDQGPCASASATVAWRAGCCRTLECGPAHDTPRTSSAVSRSGWRLRLWRS